MIMKNKKKQEISRYVFGCTSQLVPGCRDHVTYIHLVEAIRWHVLGCADQLT